jgi:hypothetical protein
MNNQLPASQNDHLLHAEPKSLRRRKFWRGLAVLGSITLVGWIWLSPTYSFHPMCTYSVNARLSADVEISGQKLTSTVTYQNSHSRQWISGLNSAGCKPLEGNALTFKLANDSLLIVPSRICRAGVLEFAQSGHVDILSACTKKQAHQDAAFMVDSASRPTKWFAVTNGINFHITSMKAVSTWSNPEDDIELLAPNLLQSNFKYGHQQWSRSPETILSFDRRYSLLRQRPDQKYQFEVKNEEFALD